MSKTTKVIYGTSILIGDKWDKIGVEQDPEKGDTIESILDEVSGRIQKWHEKKYPEFYKQEKKDSDKKHISEEDVHFLGLKDAVISAQTKEDAMGIINNSGNYKVALQFQTKEVIDSKPNKI